jgi:hypothetical protein
VLLKGPGFLSRPFEFNEQRFPTGDQEDPVWPTVLTLGAELDPDHPGLIEDQVAGVLFDLGF